MSDEVIKDSSHREKQDDLLPCPFCGSERVSLLTLDFNLIGQTAVICDDCLAIGPRSERGSAEAARVAWDHRPNALHELPPPCGSECTQDATGG